MTSHRPLLFHKRWFEPTVIVTCVRFYLRFSLSLRDVKELMAERGLAMDHTTIWRWVQAYGPEGDIGRIHLRNNLKMNLTMKAPPALTEAKIHGGHEARKFI